ncbi:TPA: circadian clock protein KaiC [Legionella pneumophila subsp. pneumophila]|uniref:circadian clock protein KaiC n=1 Tax=Legionella pneumophila TaxID=446 RepID=UPI000770A14B|nr:circadian clock protein KaiC [Legionella pneumophila]HAT8849702.1 circadian clock protein KaiC [Legionella pneumophila subsp. pneumophila]CZH76146.1 Circadian clock protein kinase kaiC [Legionella pneumophila]CZI60142.1 Circadian clock protein kinase kaiC [Legionella pneumophila]HAT9169603.1 circadian clock protein KaiC [Legionella pneumophila subsp. pneumophila]HAT9585162.1 circadian clock protein KaiC [Legionella pneumophila subsp. pneumophila]
MNIYKTKTGVKGLDDVLNGGYLKNEPTLLKGGPGTGKTIFTLFFTHEQLKSNNNVIYITCDESPEKIIAHMDGFNLEGGKFLQEGKFLILDFTPVLSDEVAGEFNINALLLRIEQAQQKIKANTLIIDSLQSILLGIKNYDPNYELLRLFQWARQKNLTVLTTMAETQTILQTEIYDEYVVDCAIELKQKVNNDLMTRYLRIIKNRGSSHGTNEYPFSITHKGISLLPITSTKLNTTIPAEYLRTGIKVLDRMLDNKGYQTGSQIIISGRSGTAKTLFAASFAQSAVRQGRKVLFISFEESPNDLIHHVKSINIDLMKDITKKKLHIDSRRSVEMGLEDHIISIIELTEEKQFDVLILDPISSLLDLGNTMEVKRLFIRFISHMKSINKTLFFTELIPDYSKELTILGLSSLTETWIRLSNVESNGEFNRLIHIAKARGIKTSNQIKEFYVTDKGINIEAPYLGDNQMMFGSQKSAHILREKQELQQRKEEIKRIELEIDKLAETQRAQLKIQEATFLAKRNELIAKEEALVKRMESNKLLRE